MSEQSSRPQAMIEEAVLAVVDRVLPPCFADDAPRPDAQAGSTKGLFGMLHRHLVVVQCACPVRLPSVPSAATQ